MWEMTQISEAIAFLEARAEYFSKEKSVQMKKRCEEEHGLTFDNPEMLKIERFMKWMRDGGAKFKNVRMRYYGPDYRGVHAYENVESNENFLNVPNSLIITPQSGRDSELGRKILKSGVKLNWDYLVYITVFLMAEMHNPTSKWKPYLDVYPRLASNFPLFYSESEKSMLKGSPMLDHISSEYNQIKEEYYRILGVVPDFKQFTPEEYIRNKVLVVSRIFYVKMHGIAERIMVPLAGNILIHYSYIRHVQSSL